MIKLFNHTAICTCKTLHYIVYQLTFPTDAFWLLWKRTFLNTNESIPERTLAPLNKIEITIIYRWNILIPITTSWMQQYSELSWLNTWYKWQLVIYSTYFNVVNIPVQQNNKHWFSFFKSSITVQYLWKNYIAFLKKYFFINSTLWIICIWK